MTKNDMEEQKNKEKDAITKSDVLSDDKKLEILKNTDLENKIQESLKVLEPIYEMPQIQWKLSATLENLISVPMMQEIQKWTDQLKNAFSVSTKIDFSNLSKALRNMTDEIEKSIHKIQIPSITEKRKQEILEKHKQWGCYGWTKNPYFEEILFANITLDKKSADALALKQCSREKMTLLFGNISEHKRVKKADFAEAVFGFENKKYKSCASKKGSFSADQTNFSKIPGSPVAYWVSSNLLNDFTLGDALKNSGDTRQGMATSDNNRFLRLWHESSFEKIGFGCHSAQEAIESQKKWFPYNKGGEFRKWYGNNDFIINYENDGFEVKSYASSLYKQASRTIKSMSEYFKPSISWSKISSGSVAFRYYPDGFIFDVAGCCIFYKNSKIMYYDFGFLNSLVAKSIFAVISPTLNYEAGHVASLPIIFRENMIDQVNVVVQENIILSRNDWDSFETSWDFQHHPLLRKVPTIAEAFDQWRAECDERFNQLKANEEELNRIFIDIYGLQDELTPEVDDKDVTVRKADLGRDIRSFISYAVGCMFGRYSLDVDGLAYAGGEWDKVNSSEGGREGTLGCASKYASFAADKDNIIPICDDEYFEDDIVGLFVEFVKTVYGAETLDENLKFIADALGGKGQPKDVIRNYFLSDFYSDHCKIYQKRPIYWLFASGKKNGFKALIYMHRYQPDTIARIRTDYVHEQQARYRTAIADLEQRIANASTGERVKLNKKLTTLQAQDAEIRTYEEKIHHLADQMISIDLDDGVKKNYAIFQDVLAKIK